MYTYYFEKLDVWIISKDLVKEVYNITNSYPKNENFGLKSQIRRSAISVPTNLAEGSSRKTRKDQVHFTNISFSSLMELLNLFIISFELNYIDEVKYHSIRNKINEIARKLNGLKKAQEKY